MILPVIAAFAAAGAVWSLFSGSKRFNLPQYAPGTPEQAELFRAAADVAGVPQSWATHPALLKILASESGGWVGTPNFLWDGWLKKQGLPDNRSSWPAIWQVIKSGQAKPSVTGISSHAAGLGQLQPSNMIAFQPDGLNGVGDALNEAVGMLRYIKHRYGTMDAAWAFWQAHSMY